MAALGSELPLVTQNLRSAFGYLLTQRIISSYRQKRYDSGRSE